MSGCGTTSMSRLVDRLPAADAGAVEAEAVFEDVFVELVGRDGEVLPQAGEVHEAQVDGLDFLLADQRQNFFRCHVRHPFVNWGPSRDRVCKKSRRVHAPAALAYNGANRKSASGVVGRIPPTVAERD